MATFQIVVLNASVISAPIPNDLQQKGALISQGGSKLSPNTIQTVATPAEALALVASPLPILSLTWLSSVVTLTTTNPHGFTVGDVVPIVVAGAVPTAYNGTFTGTVTDASTITYPLASNPGAETTPGTVLLGSALELTQMITTYFNTVGSVAVQIVELGEGTASEGVSTLSALITSIKGTNLQQYAYLVPRSWDNNLAFLTLINNYNAVNSMLYFYTTTTVANRAVYAGMKCVFAMVEAPSIGATEFSCASPFANAIKVTAGSSTRVPPMQNTPSYGTTAYPIRGNQSVFLELATANVGWIDTGAEGGITNNIIKQGKFSDGKQWSFWYSTDWAQINFKLNIANEVINGSATSINPLYYDQPGVDRLQTRVAQTAAQGVAAGLGAGQVIQTKLTQDEFNTAYNAGKFNGKIVVNAVPFLNYVGLNPSDYEQGKYAGLTCIWVTKLGFQTIYFNLEATDLISV